VSLFVNLSRSKEKFWQRDWEGLAEELSRGAEIIQHGEYSPESNSDSTTTEPSDNSMQSSLFEESPATQTSPIDQAVKAPAMPTNGGAASRTSSRREKHLRKAAFFAADSLSVASKLGVTFADFTSRELPLQSAMSAFDCSQVLAEWVASLQDRVGQYLGILGHDAVDLSQVPAIMLLEEEDVKLLDKVHEILAYAEAKMNLDLALGGTDAAEQEQLQSKKNGYAVRILRVTAYVLDKSAVWPVTRLMSQCLETHANSIRERAEKSTMAL
jgi:hypothetical protein